MIRHKIQVEKIAELTKKINAFALRVSVKSEYLYASFKSGKSRIDVYRSGTIVIQGAEELRLAVELFGDNFDANLKIAAVKKGLASPVSGRSTIGCDEVGTGDYFGGITVCAAFAAESDLPWLKRIGVKDSKAMGDEKILEIAPQVALRIKNCCLTARPEIYNSLYVKHKNANALKSILHNEALTRLTKRLNEEQKVGLIVVMDQFAPRATYYAHLNKAGVKNIEEIHIFETKAEKKYMAVAAASVLARSAWLQDMTRLSAMAGFELQRGASSPLVLSQAKQIYARGGTKLLNEFVKTHFSYTSEIVSGKVK